MILRICKLSAFSTCERFRVHFHAMCVFLLLAVSVAPFCAAQCPSDAPCVCEQLSATNCDQELAFKILDARPGATDLQLSNALFITAKFHADQLIESAPSTGCNLRSWSDGPDNGAGDDIDLWVECCVPTSAIDIATTPACEKSKPAEITTAWSDKKYPGNGWSIVAEDDSLELCFGRLIIQYDGHIRSETWQTIGARWQPPYCVVWFGDVPDPTEYYADSNPNYNENTVFFENTSTDPTVIIVGVGGGVLVLAAAGALFYLYSTGYFDSPEAREERKNKKKKGISRSASKSRLEMQQQQTLAAQQAQWGASYNPNQQWGASQQQQQSYGGNSMAASYDMNAYGGGSYAGGGY